MPCVPASESLWLHERWTCSCGPEMLQYDHCAVPSHMQALPSSASRQQRLAHSA